MPATSISIISPYNAQVVHLASLVHPQYPDVEVGSVDSNQGRENGALLASPAVSSSSRRRERADALRCAVLRCAARADVVIVSLVRSNEHGEVGFLRELRRLNVSMTRPRRQLVVVGDSDTVSKGSKFLARWMAWLEDEALVRVP